MDEKEVTPYLDYLDKEMSIMGILSTFSVAVLALVLDRVVSAEKGHLADVWQHGFLYIALGSASMLFAALFFYSQRSFLAWYYGQISLCVSTKPEEVSYWLTEADSWAAWIRYRIAFGCMAVAFIEYGMGVFGATNPRFAQNRFFYGFAPVLLAFAVLTPWLVILVKYKYQDRYFQAFWLDLKLWFKTRYG